MKMENVMKMKLPVGIENFEEIRTEGFYYIDKTCLIRDLLRDWGKVNLFTRPRRFGKSLNMSMLKSFFEVGGKKELFDGLEISRETALCEAYMGKFPVVSVSLKGVNGNDFETARSMMCSVIGKEALRFQFLLESEKLTPKEKAMYHQLTDVDEQNRESFVMPDSVLEGSLQTLSMLLQKHYGSKVIILIDEYDVPLAKANENGYYERMVLLIRNMFEQALKTNDSLYFAVLTGCLRVSKESVFTGLNNPKILSVTSVRFDEYFGFTDKEVREMLEYYNLSEAYGVVKEWYDGYHFGDVDVFCPWDVVSYVDELKDDPNLEPKDYWSNTSGNDIMRRFLRMAKSTTKREIEELIAGGTVTKVIKEELTYRDLYQSIENVWSVLFTTGYLTQKGKKSGKKVRLVIPNEELRNMFLNQILEWIQEIAREDGALLRAFCEAFKDGNAQDAQNRFKKYLDDTISIRDTAVRQDLKENFYHGILLGLLAYKDDWYVVSNKESGDGYSDIMVEISDEKIGMVIEVKYAEDGNLEAGCQEALKQIENRRYVALLRADGMRRILKYGVACRAKECRIEVVEEKDI